MAPERTPASSLPRRFRKLPVAERRHVVASRLNTPETREAFSLTGESNALVELADVLVESAVGYIGVPLGLADGILIDGVPRTIPLATEEPSVIAAASYAAKIVSAHGGFETWNDAPIMTGTVYFEKSDSLLTWCSTHLEGLTPVIRDMLRPMEQRGGGLKTIGHREIGRFLVIRFDVDVRDAMGANTINTTAEALGKLIEDATGAVPVMAILTNSSSNRLAGARFSIPIDSLPPNTRYGASEIAERICLAGEIAATDPDRAVTHNKGIMNGISALALATGNDTRGIEAAAHAWAVKDGRTAPLSSYRIEDDRLTGEIELPVPFGTVGGAVSFHPAAQASLAILDAGSSGELARIAAALGLAQNLAALLALVSGGIQGGHMRLHTRRLAFAAGARGEEIEPVARRLLEHGRYNSAAATEALATLRDQRETDA